MKYVSSNRRQIVMAVLLGFASVGAVVRYWAPNPSTLRDVGTLLLVLWLPAVGNLVAFVVRKLPRRQAAAAPASIPGFADAIFSGDVLVRLSPAVEDGPSVMASLPPDERRSMLIVGREGFTVRTDEPLTSLLAAGHAAIEVPLQLLRPELALRRLLPGTDFYLSVGATAIAEGQVVRLLGDR